MEAPAAPHNNIRSSYNNNPLPAVSHCYGSGLEYHNAAMQRWDIYRAFIKRCHNWSEVVVARLFATVFFLKQTMPLSIHHSDLGMSRILQIQYQEWRV
jgi:hypothetical protein